MNSSVNPRPSVAMCSLVTLMLFASLPAFSQPGIGPAFGYLSNPNVPPVSLFTTRTATFGTSRAVCWATLAPRDYRRTRGDRCPVVAG